MMNEELLEDLGVRRDMVVLDNGKKPNTTTITTERTWGVEKLTRNSDNPLSSVMQITGELQLDALQQAFNAVVNRHQILRTLFHAQEQSEILAEQQWNFDVLNFSRASFAEIKDFTVREIKRSFKLHQQPGIRTILIQGAEDCYYLAVILHPTVADKQSVAVFCDHLIQAYESIVIGQETDSTVEHHQYSDHLDAVSNRLKVDEEASLAYWKEKLNGSKPAMLKPDLEADEENCSYSVLNYQFSSQAYDSLSRQSSESGMGSQSFALAAYKILLTKCTGQQDVIVGVPYENRTLEDLKAVIGPVENTLPVRSEIDLSKTFSAFVEDLKMTCNEAGEHQHISCEQIGNDHDSKLIQTKWIFQSGSIDNVAEHAGTRFEWSVSPIENCPFEMTFTLAQENEGLKGYVVYRADLFEKSTVLEMMQQLDHLFHLLGTEPNMLISDISLSDLEDKIGLSEYVVSSEPFRKELALAPL